jgi:hypothetical protein
MLLSASGIWNAFGTIRFSKLTEREHAQPRLRRRLLRWLQRRRIDDPIEPLDLRAEPLVLRQ